MIKMGWVILEAARPFKVTCDSCNLEEVFRTQEGAAMFADLHEIALPPFTTAPLYVVDKDAKED